jgi:geranylgeranyl transferase type-1 subunit beta
VLRCQHLRTGGFGKDAESYPDPMHTYYALAGLALTGCPGLQPLDPTLSISARAVVHLRGLHDRYGW